MMYLPKDKWSSRYGQKFYTIYMTTYTIINNPSELPQSDNDYSLLGDDDILCSLFGNIICNNHNTSFPAVYYEIQVLCGTNKHTILRRYSQFDQLYKMLDSRNNMKLRNRLPPKTLSLLHKVIPNDDVLNKRLLGLYNFINELLIRKESVDNPLIERFLELKLYLLNDSIHLSRYTPIKSPPRRMPQSLCCRTYTISSKSIMFFTCLVLHLRCLHACILQHPSTTTITICVYQRRNIQLWHSVRLLWITVRILLVKLWYVEFEVQEFVTVR